MHQRHDWELQAWVPAPVPAKFFSWDFQHLSTLTDFNWIVSMVKSDLMDAYTIRDSSCGSKSKWALVHLCTCKAAANRSNVYESGKKYSLFLRQCKVYQPAQSQRKKGAKKPLPVVALSSFKLLYFHSDNK